MMDSWLEKLVNSYSKGKKSQRDIGLSEIFLIFAKGVTRLCFSFYTAEICVYGSDVT